MVHNTSKTVIIIKANTHRENSVVRVTTIGVTVQHMRVNFRMAEEMVMDYGNLEVRILMFMKEST